jgi:hypothetical protein
MWAARIVRFAHRAGNDFHWFWIGSHEPYNTLLQRLK